MTTIRARAAHPAPDPASGQATAHVTAPTEGSSAPTPGRQRHGLRTLESLGLPILAVIAVVVFSLLKPDTFATPANWVGIGISQSVTIIAALALIIPLNTGRFDLSVGSNMVMCSMVAGSLMSNLGLPLVAAAVLTLMVGGVVGVVNGVVVSYFGVNSFVATLGSTTVIGGIVIATTNGSPISSNLSPFLVELGFGTFFGVPLLVVVCAIFALITWYLLTQTPFGRYLTAVGSNITSATLVGVKVRRVVLYSFVASGVLGGVGGLMLISLQGNANPSTDGIGIVLPAMAAAFLGSTAFTPGRFNVPGALVGLLFVAATVAGLASIGAEPWVQPVINGGSLIIAVALSAQIRRARTGVKEVGQ